MDLGFNFRQIRGGHPTGYPGGAPPRKQRFLNPKSTWRWARVRGGAREKSAKHGCSALFEPSAYSRSSSWTGNTSHDLPTEKYPQRKSKTGSGSTWTKSGGNDRKRRTPTNRLANLSR